jgi:hypothetical protein
MKVSDIYGGYLKAADLGEQDVTVTIQGGELRELEDKRRLQITFEESVRPLLLNVTNARQIAQLYGEEATEWKGKRITLYATTCDFAGRTVACIRIRDQVPQTVQSPERATAASDSSNVVMRF